MKRPSLIDILSSTISPVKRHIPTKVVDLDSVGTDGNGNKYVFDGDIEYSHYDYLNFIAKTSNGLTGIGQKLLQESIDSYVYSVLGAQARMRCTIVGGGARSLQTQDVSEK